MPVLEGKCGPEKDLCLSPVAGAEWYHRLFHYAVAHQWTHLHASVQTLKEKVISSSNLEITGLDNEKVKEF